MKTKNILVAFSFLALYISACKKADTAPDNNTPPVATADSNYLSVIYDIYINGTAIDTAASYIYSYDANKRVTQLKDSVWHPTGDYRTETIVYFYNGNDTLPYKSVKTTVLYLPKPNEVTNSFYSYNSTGLRIKDSVAGPYNHYVALHQFQTGKITSSRVDSFFSTSGAFSYKEIRKDTAIKDAKGNVVSSISYRGSAYVYTATVTYDNQPSPLMKLSNAKTLALFPMGETLVLEMPQINNRLKILEKVSLNNQPFTTIYDDDLTGKYTYKTNGYPSQIKITDPSTGEIEIGAFKYRSL